jgi:hypothetical protein
VIYALCFLIFGLMMIALVLKSALGW